MGYFTILNLPPLLVQEFDVNSFITDPASLARVIMRKSCIVSTLWWFDKSNCESIFCIFFLLLLSSIVGCWNKRHPCVACVAFCQGVDCSTMLRGKIAYTVCASVWTPSSKMMPFRVKRPLAFPSSMVQTKKKIEGNQSCDKFALFLRCIPL